MMVDFVRRAITGWALVAAMAWPLQNKATLILSADQNEVYDSSSSLTWLAQANLPATLSLGLSCSKISGPNCIGQGGSMNFATAVDWIARLNQSDYEGHSNWQLPTVSGMDSGCTATGALGNSFAFDCANNAFGSLYFNSLGLKAPNPALLAAQNTVGPFTNFQPNNYWTGTPRHGTLPRVASRNFVTGCLIGHVTGPFRGVSCAHCKAMTCQTQRWRPVPPWCGSFRHRMTPAADGGRHGRPT